MPEVGLQTREFIVLGVTIGPHHRDCHPGILDLGLYGLCPNGELTL